MDQQQKPPVKQYGEPPGPLLLNSNPKRTLPNPFAPSTPAVYGQPPSFIPPRHPQSSTCSSSSTRSTLVQLSPAIPGKENRGLIKEADLKKERLGIVSGRRNEEEQRQRQTQTNVLIKVENSAKEERNACHRKEDDWKMAAGVRTDDNLPQQKNVLPNPRRGEMNRNGGWARTKYSGSNLCVKVPTQWGNEFSALCRQPVAHGYTEANAHWAMRRFLHRKLLRIDERQLHDTGESGWGRSGCVCHKLISVPAINAGRWFKGKGAAEEEAEAMCDLNIIIQLYDLDMIKEAAVELYSLGRRNLMEPTRKLDKKLFAWLNSSTPTWLRRMDAIEAKTRETTSLL